MELIVKLDHYFFFLINNGLGCKGLDSIFEGLSSLGGWTVCLIAISLLAGAGRKILWRHILVLFIMVLVMSTVTNVLKRTIARSRPVKVFQSQVDSGDVSVRVIGKPLRRKSFPSGHSMLAFLMMTYVAFVKKPYRFLVLLLASLIAISRVYVGAHFPLDCIAGAMLGGFGGWLGALCYVRLNEKLEAAA